MEEGLWEWGLVEGDVEEKVEGCGGKNFWFWCQTILEKYYFDYQGREAFKSKVERRWRKDGGRFMGVGVSGGRCGGV